ncbi:CCN family member 2 [Taenia crassiceps]|uniref:CCN family member 2 n=1 Tax=Taenia crassiceps TaxID=6207 RepID=A0ABR4QFS6_9CEST
MSLPPSMGLAVAVTMWLVLFEAAPGSLVGKKHPDRRWNGCSTANANLQHGAVIRPDCCTECFCDDGVLLCKDLCATGGFAGASDKPQSQNHRKRPPPLESLCKLRPPMATQWSPCSKTCGLGVSFRVTNNNTECRNQTEAQLCHWKPCSRVSSHRCAPTRRVEHPQTFRLVIVDNRKRRLTRRVMGKATSTVETPTLTSATSNSDATMVCESVRRYRPKYCTRCDSLEAHCCVPIRTKTTPVNFRCSDGRTMQHNLEWIKRCACHPSYCKYLSPIN